MAIYGNPKTFLLKKIHGYLGKVITEMKRISTSTNAKIPLPSRHLQRYVLRYSSLRLRIARARRHAPHAPRRGGHAHLHARGNSRRREMRNASRSAERHPRADRAGKHLPPLPTARHRGDPRSRRASRLLQLARTYAY